MKYFSASFYYVRYSILFKIIGYCYRRWKWRVWLLSLIFIPLYFLNQFIHLVFRLLDEIFCAGYRRVEIKQPVFIIANPRSGTTYLHRLISLDGERFTYTKLAHTFFMTASFAKLANAVKGFDKLIGSPIRWVINRFDSLIWGGWDDMHPMGFSKAEEDELPFAQMMMSAGVLIPFPYFHLVHGNKFLDKEPAHVRQYTMDFYESCVKRYVYATGENKTYLAKNVNSTGRFQSLLSRFPDAKIIYIARHPYEAVPSFASMFSSMYGAGADAEASRRAWAELGIEYYAYLKEMREQIPPAQFIAVKYDDLIAQPKDTVLKIYGHFGWEARGEFVSSLEREQNIQRNYSSKHEYQLGDYGLSKEYIYERLSGVFEEFGFER